MEDRMTAQKLKNSILQMAVQGKLVPQDPNDEPASVLLERIRKEKEQLIKEGKIKRNKNESYIFRGADNLHYEQIGKEVRCIEDELPFEIPDSWEWGTLNSCTDVRDGTHDTPKYCSSGYPLITSKNLIDGKIDFSTAKLISEDDYIKINQRSKVNTNDILFAMIGSIGNPVLYLGNEEFSIKNMALFKSIYRDVDMNYINLFLDYEQNNMRKQASGGVQSFVSLNYLCNYRIPLPPFKEQMRIVNKIKELEPLIRNYKIKEEQLFLLNSNIKEQLKKSILQFAIEGKLVPQDPNDEPASVLLERIREEKQKLIAEGKIKKDKNESIIYRRDNSYYEKFGKQDNKITDEITINIPSSWSISRLKDLVEISTGKKDANYGSEIGKYDFFTCANTPIKADDYSYSGEYLIMPGNGANIGTVIYYNGKFEAYQRTYLLKNIYSINLKWMKYHLESNWKEYNSDKMYGSAIPYIKLSNLENYLVYIPPLAEQNKIIEFLNTTNAVLEKL